MFLSRLQVVKGFGMGVAGAGLWHGVNGLIGLRLGEMLKSYVVFLDFLPIVIFFVIPYYFLPSGYATFRGYQLACEVNPCTIKKAVAWLGVIGFLLLQPMPMVLLSDKYDQELYDLVGVFNLLSLICSLICMVAYLVMSRFWLQYVQLAESEVSLGAFFGKKTVLWLGFLMCAMIIDVVDYYLPTDMITNTMVDAESPFWEIPVIFLALFSPFIFAYYFYKTAMRRLGHTQNKPSQPIPENSFSRLGKKN